MFGIAGARQARLSAYPPIVRAEPSAELIPETTILSMSAYVETIRGPSIQVLVRSLPRIIEVYACSEAPVMSSSPTPNL